jgi:uncharacterized protein YndB with AHSA1/START domain
MNLKLESQFPVTDEAAKTATGKSLKEWFAILDSRGGPTQGRRAINDYLYGECKVDAWWVSTINIEYEAARGVVEKDGRPKGFNICVTKTIAAPVDKVYASWASDASLDQWFGSGNKADVQNGGSYSNSDGDSGVFKRVRPNKDLRFTWENPACKPGSIVDVVFQDKGKGKTGIVVTHDRVQTRAEADGLRNAWGEALDRLKVRLEG